MSENNLSTIQQTRSAIMQTPEMITHIARWGFSFIRAKVLVNDGRGKYLVVEEKRAKVNGIWQDVRDIWNFPGGSLKNPTEDLFTAARREVLEETGYVIKLTGFLGIQQTMSDDPCVTIMLIGESRGFKIGEIDEKEIWSVAWRTEQEIRELESANKMRSASSNIIMLDHQHLASDLNRVIMH